MVEGGITWPELLFGSPRLSLIRLTEILRERWIVFLIESSLGSLLCQCLRSRRKKKKKRRQRLLRTREWVESGSAWDKTGCEFFLIARKYATTGLINCDDRCEAMLLAQPLAWPVRLCPDPEWGLLAPDQWSDSSLATTVDQQRRCRKWRRR